MHYILIILLRTACNCNPSGIVDSGLCDDNGQCNCKVNVGQGTRDCSQCRDGYWNLTESNPDGCQGVFVQSIIIISL